MQYNNTFACLSTIHNGRAALCLRRMRLPMVSRRNALLWLTAIGVITATESSNSYAASLKRQLFLSSDGVSICYVRNGSGSKKLLLIPGFLADADIWQKQLAFFTKIHDVIAVDPRGQGESAAPLGALGSRERVSDYTALIDHVSWSSCTVIGWSVACAEALSLYDLLGASKIRGLALIDGFLGTNEEDVRAKRSASVDEATHHIFEKQSAMSVTTARVAELAYEGRSAALLLTAVVNQIIKSFL
jgi:pimeloyl-ACP methyl ester carboxylesterase